ncbi:MAG TPA: hypothetical protein VGK64_22650 [Bryobacteraceae bacterium]
MYLGLQMACNRTPPLIDEDPSKRVGPFDGAASGLPVVVGRIVSNSRFGTPHPSHWNRYRTVQLYGLAIHVENVLQGDIQNPSIDVYYFADVGSQGGPARLGMREDGGQWRIGDRELFVLRREAGVFRTVCDFSAVCVTPVLTGAHPAFRRNISRSIKEDIVEILLTRGEHCDDSQMIRAISSDPRGNPAWSFSESYTFKKLRQIATEETSAVRKAACEDLSSAAEIRRITLPWLRTVCP